jgi:hypothetical protein
LICVQAVQFIRCLQCSAFTDKVERNCHLPPFVLDLMTHRQAAQDFPDTSQEWLRENNKISFPVLWELLLGAGK